MVARHLPHMARTFLIRQVEPNGRLKPSHSEAVGEEVASLWKTRQAAAARRSPAEVEGYLRGMLRVNSCSENMLRAGAGVWRSSRYGANLEMWQASFGKAGIKVLTTEELERDPAAVVASVVDYFGLPPAPPAGLGAAAVADVHKRHCVTGKRGIMDSSRANKYAAPKAFAECDDGAQDACIGVCAGDEDKQKGGDGLLRYPIEAGTERLLRDYFAPLNQNLYKLAGRDLGWPK